MANCIYYIKKQNINSMSGSASSEPAWCREDYPVAHLIPQTAVKFQCCWLLLILPSILAVLIRCFTSSNQQESCALKAKSTNIWRYILSIADSLLREQRTHTPRENIYFLIRGLVLGYIRCAGYMKGSWLTQLLDKKLGTTVKAVNNCYHILPN